MDLLGIFISLAIIVYSSILHEIAHGWVAYRLGDPTAKVLGRLTLNPVKHIDPWMSILMPLMILIASGGRFVFGGAKPVPVDIFNLKEGLKDFALISLVGPLTNLLIAIVGSILMHLLFPGASFGQITLSGIFGFILSQIVYLNLLLAIFNLIPLPPLDGSKVFAMILPRREAEAYLSFGSNGLGMLILVFLLFFPIGGFSLFGLISTLIDFSLSLLGF